MHDVAPIFLHASACKRDGETADAPEIFLDCPQMMVRGCGRDDRILHGSGQVVPSAALTETAAALLRKREIAYAHVRSATNNCYRCRIERA